MATAKIFSHKKAKMVFCRTAQRNDGTKYVWCRGGAPKPKTTTETHQKAIDAVIAKFGKTAVASTLNKSQAEVQRDVGAGMSLMDAIEGHMTLTDRKAWLTRTVREAVASGSGLTPEERKETADLTPVETSVKEVAQPVVMGRYKAGDWVRLRFKTDRSRQFHESAGKAVEVVRVEDKMIVVKTLVPDNKGGAKVGEYKHRADMADPASPDMIEKAKREGLTEVEGVAEVEELDGFKVGDILFRNRGVAGRIIHLFFHKAGHFAHLTSLEADFNHPENGLFHQPDLNSKVFLYKSEKITEEVYETKVVPPFKPVPKHQSHLTREALDLLNDEAEKKRSAKEFKTQKRVERAEKSDAKMEAIRDKWEKEYKASGKNYGNDFNPRRGAHKGFSATENKSARDVYLVIKGDPVKADLQKDGTTGKVIMDYERLWLPPRQGGMDSIRDLKYKDVDEVLTKAEYLKRLKPLVVKALGEDGWEEVKRMKLGEM